MKENPIIPSKTTCYICGNVETCGEHDRWYDFIVEREHLFIRNINTEDGLEQMENVIIPVTITLALRNSLNLSR